MAVLESFFEHHLRNVARGIEVCSDGAVKEDRFLRNYGEGFTEAAARDVGNVDAVE